MRRCVRKCFFLSLLLTGCSTLSAIRNLDPTLPDGSVVTLQRGSQDQASDFQFTIRSAPLAEQSDFWSRHGELQLSGGIPSRCGPLSTFVSSPYSGPFADAFSLRANADECQTLSPGHSLAVPKVKPGTTALCKLPPGAAPDCSVIFFHPDTATAEAPIAAYRGDGRPIAMESKQTDWKWLRLGVSPAIDLLRIPLFALLAVALY
jgi:hypothetical protein